MACPKCKLKSISYFFTLLSRVKNPGLLQELAGQLDLSIASVPISGDVNENTYMDIFEAMSAGGADGLIVSDTPANTTNSCTIATLANQFKLPAVYPYRESAVAGGLLAYSIELSEAYHLAARQIADIFAGAKPADLPILQQTRFQLIANVKAAQAIDLTLPPSLSASGGRGDWVNDSASCRSRAALGHTRQNSR